MDEVRTGARPWANLDELHRLVLDRLLTARGVVLPQDDRAWINARWHELRPWPDVVAGMQALRERFILGSLSNGNVALQVDLARYAGLPFDVLISAEHFGHYKPDAEVYRGAAKLLMRAPERIMLVAAHNSDLAHAAAEGYRTAFVARPTEYGPRQERDLAAGPCDVAVTSIAELDAALR